MFNLKTGSVFMSYRKKDKSVLNYHKVLFVSNQLSIY